MRALTLASGAGRIAIGVGLALAPRQALAALGFADASPATVAVARIAGGRDIAMGAETLLARGDRVRLTRSSLSNAAVDAGDALAFSTALAAGEQVGGAALRGITAALPAAGAGLWVAWRLGALASGPGS
ncbi:MAG: hypothetical protein M3O25_10475 [Actinomycetota bacterium]|nr:hypothetical protein [Actinomycetota bacterium]